MTTTSRYQVTTYELRADNGRPLRLATMVTDSESGRVYRSEYRLPPGQAIERAKAFFAGESK
jgi:hypothetical protein